jgi:TonB family protein
MRLLILCWLLVVGSVGAAQVREYRYTDPQQLEAMIVHKQKPEYPLEARRRLQQGQCYVRLYVARDGSVTGVKIVQSTGYDLLDASCLQAFRNFRLKPGLRREIDVPVSFMISQYGNPLPSPAQRRPTIVREFRD